MTTWAVGHWRILQIVVLMIILGRIEPGEGFNLSDNGVGERA